LSNDLYQSKQLIALLPQIDDVVGNGAILVRGHWQRLPTDERDPLCVSSASESAYVCCVGTHRSLNRKDCSRTNHSQMTHS